MDINGYLNLIPFVQSQKTKYMELLRTLLEPAVDLHGVLGSFQYVFNLDNAVGNQLDVIGENVGVERSLSYNLPLPSSDRPTIIHQTRSSSDVVTLINWREYRIYKIVADSLDQSLEIGDILAFTFTDDVVSERLSRYEIETDTNYAILNFPSFVVGQLVFEAQKTYYFGLVEENGRTGFWFLDYNPEEAEDNTADIRRMTDDEYRMMIRLRIARNQWDGTNESAEHIYRTILGNSIELRQKDNQNGSVDIRVEGTATQRLLRIIEETDNLLVPAGIMKNVVESDDETGTELRLGAKAVGLEIYEEAAMIGE